MWIWMRFMRIRIKTLFSMRIRIKLLPIAILDQAFFSKRIRDLASQNFYEKQEILFLLLKILRFS